ncbi:hypothetical protein [Burkholderia ubonensis]|uniref:hypothetical protein n=1 Tax=Burkholderia ubonensis TaxID=101571 RepID=UPI0012FB0479|nr:hypothetical protein [Burkholderia ubonensis]
MKPVGKKSGRYKSRPHEKATHPRHRILRGYGVSWSYYDRRNLQSHRPRRVVVAKVGTGNQELIGATMSTENIPLTELLTDGETFGEFARRLIATGWVADDDIGVSRVAFRRTPQRDELAALCEKFGYRDLLDMRLQAIALKHGDGNHVYYIFNLDEFSDFQELRVGLRRAGFDV